MPLLTAKPNIKKSSTLITLCSALFLSFSSVTAAVNIIPSPPEINAKGHILIDTPQAKSFPKAMPMHY